MDSFSAADRDGRACVAQALARHEAHFDEVRAVLRPPPKHLGNRNLAVVEGLAQGSHREGIVQVDVPRLPELDNQAQLLVLEHDDVVGQWILRVPRQDVGW